MIFYKPSIKENMIVCTLCRHYCSIKKGRTGICGVNKNTGDTIECLVYGYPSAINVDPIEKKPLYHFLPGSKVFSLGTVGCNFHCPFCQNWDISQTSRIDTSHYYSPEKIVDLALENECKSIAYTYNEPTVFYPYARDITLEGKKRGLKNVYVSNGYESEEVINDMAGIIDAINVDLKSFNPDYYKKNLGGDLQKVIENLRLFVEKGIWLEITTLLVPTQNDSLEEIREIASFIAKELGVEIPWHISAFHPAYKELELPETSLTTLKNAYEIGKEEGLQYIYVGNTNFETPTQCPFCGGVLIERSYFRQTSNNLKGSNCPYCGTNIPGVFL
ncbi:MAG: AmmeMemoRadiSam system radical SAM enzyme [Spirochaetota bacterium]|nr:AmmeMemoRadiSam system radical SAM enzyme [Spirochaetota bacterium]